MRTYEMEEGKKMVKTMFGGGIVFIFAFLKRTISEGLLITFLFYCLSQIYREIFLGNMV